MPASYLASRSRGLSEVVTSLMLIAFGVVFALTVTILTSGVTFSTMSQPSDEKISFSQKHIWVDVSSEKAVAAFKLENKGTGDVRIASIDIREKEIDWPDVYWHLVSYNKPVTGELGSIQYDALTGGSVVIDGRRYVRGTAAITVESGRSLLFYVRAPESIRAASIGKPVVVILVAEPTNISTQVEIEMA